jgi:hypothetical protein
MAQAKPSMRAKSRFDFKHKILLCTCYDYASIYQE